MQVMTEAQLVARFPDTVANWQRFDSDLAVARRDVRSCAARAAGANTRAAAAYTASITRHAVFAAYIDGAWSPAIVVAYTGDAPAAVLGIGARVRGIVSHREAVTIAARMNRRAAAGRLVATGRK